MQHAFVTAYISETVRIIDALNLADIERMADGLRAVRERGGRLFILGVGGSAGHAGHAVNDFRKLCGFEAYAPTDNVLRSDGGRPARQQVSGREHALAA